MTDETDLIGPPKPLPPRFAGDRLHIGVTNRIARGHATSYTDALALAFYMGAGREYAVAVGQMLKAFGIPRSQFGFGKIPGVDW